TSYCRARSAFSNHWRQMNGQTQADNPAQRVRALRLERATGPRPQKLPPEMRAQLRRHGLSHGFVSGDAWVVVATGVGVTNVHLPRHDALVSRRSPGVDCSGDASTRRVQILSVQKRSYRAQHKSARVTLPQLLQKGHVVFSEQLRRRVVSGAVVV